jgi:hypothetical protein
MQTTPDTLRKLILNQLAGGEMRLLVLVVGIRRNLQGVVIKGDLSERVQCTLRDLIASRHIVNDDGVYSLSKVFPGLSEVIGCVPANKYRTAISQLRSQTLPEPG